MADVVPQDANDTPEQNSRAVRIGCAGLPDGLKWDRYWAQLDYIERAATFSDLPKLAAARRWEAASPKHIGTGLVAWQGITHLPGPRGYTHMNTPLPAHKLPHAGGLRDTDVVKDGLTRLRDIAEVVGAEAVVFRTPSSFTPSQSNRDRVRHFFSELAPQEYFGTAHRVWEPQGLWEPSTAASLANELGLLYGCDPLSNDPLTHEPGFFHQLESDNAYFRMSGLGHKRTRFPDHELEELAELASQYERSWFVFTNLGAFRDAVSLRKLVAE